MTRPVAFLPAARAELFHAIEAVEALSGLGAAFRDRAERLKGAIGRAPEAHALDPDAPEGLEARRARIGRYPWRLVYLVEGERVLVVAVAHVAREPLYWLHRLG